MLVLPSYANQLTGFYMRATMALNGLIKTVLECSRSVDARSVLRSWVRVSDKIRTKRLKSYILTHLYVKI